MDSKPCNGIIPPILQTFGNDSLQTLRTLPLPLPLPLPIRLSSSISKNKISSPKLVSVEETPEVEKIENKELLEEDVIKFLTEDKDNIILVFGHKIYTGYRSVIKNSIKKPENIFVDDSGKVYYQIIGRHLIDETEIKILTSKTLSIFNISTLKNVLKLKNKASPILHSRGVYSVDAYTIDEYQEILKE